MDSSESPPEIRQHIVILKCLETAELNKPYILQDLTGLEIKISMKASKTENGLKLVFNKEKPVCEKTGVNIPI